MPRRESTLLEANGRTAKNLASQSSSGCSAFQPCKSICGKVLTWDGRLDNRAELISELRDVLTLDSTDVAIVAAVYEKWGSDCFPRLMGDWAFLWLG